MLYITEFCLFEEKVDLNGVREPWLLIKGDWKTAWGEFGGADWLWSRGVSLGKKRWDKLESIKNGALRYLKLNKADTRRGPCLRDQGKVSQGGRRSKQRSAGTLSLKEQDLVKQQGANSSESGIRGMRLTGWGGRWSWQETKLKGRSWRWGRAWNDFLKILKCIPVDGP